MPVPHHSHTTVLIISAYRQACSFSDVSSLLLCWHIYIILVSLNWLKTESICLYTWQKAYDVRSTHTHTHPFNGPFSGITQVSRYQKGKTNLDFTEARQKVAMASAGPYAVCTSSQTDNHASNPLLGFLQAGCPSATQRSVNALEEVHMKTSTYQTGDVLHDGLPHNSAWHVDSIAEDECFCGVLQAPADKQSCSAHAITHATVSTPSQHTHTHIRLTALFPGLPG